MTTADIYEAVEKLKKKYDEPDPFRLCREMGMMLRFQSFGTEPDAIKGYFIEFNRLCTITVNSDLPQFIQKIIVAHELGHATLHRRSGAHAFQEVTMYDSISVYEKEANLFAAEFLLEDEKVLEALNCDTTFFNAAAELMVPAELLDFKFRVLKWKGYKIMESPISQRNNFLRDMEIPRNTDYDIC